MEVRNHRGQAISKTIPDPNVGNNSFLPSDESGMGYIGNTVDQVFGKCVGIVDMTSTFFQSCKGHANVSTREEYEASSPISRRNRSRRSRRKQGSTLVFANREEFEDDVSALSANTLEEMERLAKHMARQSGKEQQVTTDPRFPSYGQQLVPPSVRTSPHNPKSVKDAWRYSVQRATSSTDHSIAVSTSGSASSHEEKAETTRNSFQRFHAHVDR